MEGAIQSLQREGGSVDTPEYSVVVPVYNSAHTLAELHTRLGTVLAKLARRYELIFVNDASKDDSLAVLKQIQERDSRVVVVELMRNFGQHNATLCGLSLATGRYVITLDDDLQHPPEEIPKLVSAMDEQNVDVVIARYKSKRHSPLRNLSSYIVKRLSWYTLGVPNNLKLNSFRLMKRQVAEAVVSFAGPRPRIGLIMFQITRRIINVDVEHHPRRDGVSNYRTRRLISNAIDNVVSYSALPLRLLAYGGFAAAGASVLLSVFYFIKYLEGGIGVSGFTTVVLLLLFCMGLTMTSFGILGEYLMRIIWAAERRPPFVIRETLRVAENMPNERSQSRSPGLREVM
jgi:dolichol-phosphate mannosyltransferase/undecaprenyl-phosphate 4-deoxy-4-formamido-L-arabinose transferase